MGLKELRPFIGILFYVNKIEYFAPLSSPKPKHLKLRNNIDLIKIDNGNLGVINLNNMIPVKKGYYSKINLNEGKKLDNKKYNILLTKQLDWLNSYNEEIYIKSSKLYNLYIKNKLPISIMNRCCDYKLLEEKFCEYNSESSII